MALETELASHHWTRVENRDSEKTYNRFAMDELGALGPGLNWSAFFATAGTAVHSSGPAEA
jgi:predicted metalloendopeptidase